MTAAQATAPPAAAPTTAPPSLRRLATTTVVALIVAGLILVTLVLPAEYGLDPLGAGRRLGLLQMAAPAVNAVAAPVGDGTTLAPVAVGALGQYPAEYKFDVAEIEIGPYEYVEYKYHLEKGATMVFAWSSSTPVIHDLHGEPDEVGGAEESVDKQDRQEGYGSYSAPFAGIHGWYWENPGAETVKVTLTSAGFYTSALEMRSDRTRKSHPLRSPDTLTPPAASTR